jgi:hypothetical protein
MHGHLDEALIALLKAQLPSRFDGTPPPVALSVESLVYEIDAASAEAQASEPRPDDRADDLAFDPAHPAGPYVLTETPDPGPRRVRLKTRLGDHVALTPAEVQFAPADGRRFTLVLRPDRNPADFAGVQVLYGVTAVFTRINYTQDLTLTLAADTAVTADRAEALAVAVIALHRAQLMADAAEELREANYGAAITVKSLRLTKGSSPALATRQLLLRAEMELKATRGLGADEGKPILRIRTAGPPADPARPIDIRIDVEG